jgi:curli biogenesis system outer membrane secretion channel CsgG
MLPGFNHNIRHRGTTYHVQTEDRGTAHAMVVTHLFSGGNVIASARSEYRALLAEADLADRVRALMQEQHKEMMRRLVRGAYDEAERG